MAAPPVMLLTVLEETVDPAPLEFTVIAVMAPVGVVFAVMLSNMLLVIVLVGPLEDEAPSTLFHPAMIVATLTVTFEKLFRLLVIVDPLTDNPLGSKIVTDQ